MALRVAGGGGVGGGGGVQVSNTTYTSGTVVFNNANGVSFGSSGAGGVSVSYTVPSTAGLISGLNISGGGNSQSNVTGITFSNSNGLTLGVSTGANVATITGSYTVPSTAGLISALRMSAGGGTSNNVTGVTFSNSNNITFGLSTGASVGTMTASYLPPSATRFIFPQNNLTPVSAPVNASISFQYVAIPQQITATRLDALVSWIGASSATTNTCAIAISVYAAIYTRNASTLSSLSSGSTQTTYSYASNSAGHTEFITGAIRPVSVPININASAGEYIIGFNFITATSSIGLSTTNLGQTFSMMGGAQLQTGVVYAEIGSNTAASVNLLNGMGIYSAASTGLSGAYSLSGIVMTGASLSQANIGLVFRNA